MRNYVIINGTNSNTINGLGINELPPISKPPLRVQTEEIDGRDGDIITPLGYGAYNKTITIGLFGTGYDIDNIVSFFNGEGTIVFSNEPDKYYNYKIIEQIDYEALQKFKQASITFHCQPFKYPLSETPKEIEPNIKTLSNVEIANITDSGISTLKMDLKGNTSQSGTPTPTSPIPVSVVSGDNDVVVSNANKLPYYQAATYSNNGVDYTSVGDGTYKLNNTATNTSYWEMTLDEAYTIQASDYIQLNNDKAISNVQFVLRDTTNTQIGAFGCTEINKIYSLSSYAGRTIGRIRCYVVNGTAISNLTLRPMICNSSTQIDFVVHQSQTFEVDMPIVKNLLNPIGVSSETSGITFTNNGDGTFTANGTASAGVNFALTDLTITPIVLEANTEYTQTLEILSGTFGGSIVPAFKNTGGTITYNYFNCNGNSRTDSKTTTDKMTAHSYNLYLGNGVSITNCTFRVQLEKGTSSHYTPYSSYTLELCKIGTYQDYFTKNSGKNLFDKSTITSGKLVSRTTGILDTNASYGATDFIPVVAGEQYTFTGFNYWYTAVYDENKEYLSNVDNLATITIPNGAYYLRSSFLLTNIDTAQFEKGSIATTYEPYGTGQWCKYNAIGKVVLDGSEQWSYVNHNNKSILFTTISDKSTTKQTALSNYYSYTAYSWQIMDNNCMSEENNNVLFIRDDSVSSANDYKTWLGTHNLIVYYVLSTPYLSLIEDNNLIEQLDNIQNATSYEGTTNISQVNNDKAFLMDVDYLEKGTDEITINNIGNTYAKPTIALEGNGVGNIYLNDTQIFRVELTDKMTISTSSMEAYDPDTSALLNRQVVGNYNSMTLQPGNNTIRIDGIDKATITDYIRWL